MPEIVRVRTSARICLLFAFFCALNLAAAGDAWAQANTPRNLTSTVFGYRVTLRWQAPLGGPQPTGYLVEAGPAPGATAVSVPLGNTLFFGVTAPNGTYYVRVRALFGATPGPASNEIQVFVGVPPPLAPVLTASVTQLTVRFAWTQPAGGSGVAGWQLQAGSVPGASDIAVLPLRSSVRSYTVSAPAGTYYVRLVALNASGASPPSNEVTVVTGLGVCDRPLTPTGLNAIAGQGVVRLRWDSWTGPLPSGYRLSAGRNAGTSDVGVFTLPRNTSFTTVAPQGRYFVRLAAYNACGISAFSDEIDFTVLPPGGATLVGTWNGTVSNYVKPYPWTPITSFQLTLNADPSGPGGRLPGSWSDNTGCRSTLIAGGVSVLPYVSIEQLACNDGDFILTITSSTATVVEGRCNSGPDCSFRMTRQ